MKANIHFLSYLVQLFLERKMFQKKVVEEIKTHILCSITFFFWKSCHLWDDVKQYCIDGQITNGNMTHAHCMVYTYDNVHTLKIYKTYYISTATMIARNRINFTLYVNFLSCFNSVFPCQHNSTIGPHSHLPTRCSYQKVKWPKPGNLSNINALPKNRGAFDRNMSYT
jgi:type IV secretory pathway TraG/TraD family ATPase VirD4